MALESTFQAELKKELHRMFPGCIILKNDANDIQGIPDLTILFEDRWAILEVKRSADEPYRPNQEWYLELFSRMSYSATIYPENRDQILYELQQALRSPRPTRVLVR